MARITFQERGLGEHADWTLAVIGVAAPDGHLVV